MKKSFLSIVLLWSTIFCSSLAEHDVPENSDVSDAFLFKSALEYFAEHENDYAVPSIENYESPMMNNASWYDNNNGINYQRIGRFSDEDYFDQSCVDDVIASAPACIKKIRGWHS